MNGLEKIINEWINMLVQYEATTKKFAPSVLLGDASTSKAKGKGARRWRRKKGKANAAASGLSTLVAPVGMPKVKGRWVPSQGQMMSLCIAGKKGHWKRVCPKLLSNTSTFLIEVNMITNSASWVFDTGCGAHICNDLRVLERSRKLSKDEVVLKLGDGKAVAAEAEGIVRLAVSGHVRIELKDCYYVPSMIKNINSISLLDNVGFEFMINKNYFYLMENGSSNMLEKLHNACESYLKGKMTKKPFVGQSTLASGLLDLIHSDVYGPLNTQARGGFSYFITFTDDHPRYGYIYLVRYKFEAFGRFKEFRLKVKNQTGRKIKTLRSDRGGEYLSGEFLDYLKENRILSQWTPPGCHNLIRYALETATKLFNVAPSKAVDQMLYQIWHGKPAFLGYPKETVGYYFYDPSEQKVFVLQNVVFLKKGFPADTQREELLLEESSEAIPQMDVVTSSALIVSTEDIPILRRSTRLSQQPQRCEFLGLTGQLDNDPKTYGEVILDIDSEK
ncbi:UNVERIFIED_CONTAM: Retrovirus-related Pol polyprotein from transposon TNT 1-94 [Sesamum indicum]